jgi:hypothetical protein
MSLQEMEEPGFFQALKDLVPRLDRVLDNMEIQRQQSSETIALLRGKANNQLYAGTVVLRGGAGAWATAMNFTVPYARVMYIDSGSFGPYMISNDGAGNEYGPGVYNSFAGGGDTGVVPITGRDLFISSSSTSNGPVSLFIAVFTDLGSNIVN